MFATVATSSSTTITTNTASITNIIHRNVHYND